MIKYKSFISSKTAGKLPGVLIIVVIAALFLAFLLSSTKKTGDTGTGATNEREKPAVIAKKITTPPLTSPDTGPKPTPSITPASVLNLSNWKLTLPIDTAHAGNPDSIGQPELASFILNPYFQLNTSLDGVAFRAYADGATTSGSKYPRSELREMTNNGKVPASWSSSSGTHMLTVREAITHLPAVKPEVVAAQIHDATDDVVMVRLEDKHLFVQGGGVEIGDLDNNYILGTPFTVKLLAAGGHINVYYNGVQKVDYTKDSAGLYFKAGCYTQSNTSKGDSSGAYGEVVIYGLQVSHN